MHRAVQALGWVLVALGAAAFLLNWVLLVRHRDSGTTALRAIIDKGYDVEPYGWRMGLGAALLLVGAAVLNHA